jgi:predicted amidohydrolase
MTPLTLDPNIAIAGSAGANLSQFATMAALAMPRYIANPCRVVIEAQHAPEWIKSVEARVNELLGLQQDWDTYGAEPVSIANVVAGLKVLPMVVAIDSPPPAIVPTVGRGIQFEWASQGRAVELRVDDAGTYVYVDDGSEEIEGPATARMLSRAALAIGSLPIPA